MLTNKLCDVGTVFAMFRRRLDVTGLFAFVAKCIVSSTYSGISRESKLKW